MRNVFIYLLLFGFTFSNPSARELVKTPFIAIHFFQHQHQNKDITVFAFFAMHYLGQDLKDNDTKEDMKLPFKHLIDSHSQLLFLSAQEDILPQVAVTNFEQDFFSLFPSGGYDICKPFYRPPQLIDLYNS